MRISLRFSWSLRVAFRRQQRNQLQAQRLPSLEGLPILVVLKIAGAGCAVAGKDFKALAVLADINDIRLQLGRLREKDEVRNTQEQP